MIVKENKSREKRIYDEAIVDAYGSAEQALGWYCYIDGKLAFPFRAKCIQEREISPLYKGETVKVVGMPPEEDCMHEICVMIAFKDRSLAVPLSQLMPLGVSSKIRQAILDWHYWAARGYTF
jgi:hypothetical protein